VESTASQPLLSWIPSPCGIGVTQMYAAQPAVDAGQLNPIGSPGQHLTARWRERQLADRKFEAIEIVGHGQERNASARQPPPQANEIRVRDVQAPFPRRHCPVHFGRYPVAPHHLVENLALATRESGSQLRELLQMAA